MCEHAVGGEREGHAGSAAASITFRWMPLEKKSRPPVITITLVSRARAKR
jgi:hypothetical protein